MTIIEELFNFNLILWVRVKRDELRSADSINNSLDWFCKNNKVFQLVHIANEHARIIIQSQVHSGRKDVVNRSCVKAVTRKLMTKNCSSWSYIKNRVWILIKFLNMSQSVQKNFFHKQYLFWNHNYFRYHFRHSPSSELTYKLEKLLCRILLWLAPPITLSQLLHLERREKYR